MKRHQIVVKPADEEEEEQMVFVTIKSYYKFPLVRETCFLVERRLMPAVNAVDWVVTEFEGANAEALDQPDSKDLVILRVDFNSLMEGEERSSFIYHPLDDLEYVEWGVKGAVLEVCPEADLYYNQGDYIGVVDPKKRIERLCRAFDKEKEEERREEAREAKREAKAAKRAAWLEELKKTWAENDTITDVFVKLLDK
jgi:hypothetical protein